MQTETDLEVALIARIEREGPLTFRNFMQAALYDEDHGYYVTHRPKIGGAGDYYTSSNIRPIFGATLARAFADLWSDYNDRPTVIEVGAGTGQLALDFLTAMRDEQGLLFRDLEYVIADISPAMHARQRSTLTEFEDHVSWSGLGIPTNPIKGIVFSNELIDAMPVHRVRWSRGVLEEQFVTARGNRLELAWGPASTPMLMRYIDRMGVALEGGQIIEICLDAVDWLKQVSATLVEGYLVTIDYGDDAAGLYLPARRDGTLRCFHRHQLSGSPLARVGEQDITASVNFTALIEYGSDVGLELVSLETQREFLMRAGFLELLAGLEDLKARLMAKNLIVPGGIGDGFHVLVQRKRPLPT